jgi:hypothetical protein
MKTRQQIIDESIKYWYEHSSDEYLKSDEPHLITFDAEMIQEDLDHEDIGYRECWHLLGAVAHGINAEWIDFLNNIADEQLEQSDPYAYYGLNRSDF